MSNSRNATSHTYSLEEVHAILPNIPLYHECMLKIRDRIITAIRHTQTCDEIHNLLN